MICEVGNVLTEMLKLMLFTSYAMIRYLCEAAMNAEKEFEPSLKINCSFCIKCEFAMWLNQIKNILMPKSIWLNSILCGLKIKVSKMYNNSEF